MSESALHSIVHVELCKGIPQIAAAMAAKTIQVEQEISMRAMFKRNMKIA